MKNIFYFGEVVKKYDVRVLNERELRAGAGILFLFGIISFMNAFLISNFYYLKIFITAFLIDFAVRIFVNPKYAPFLILGRFFVQNQVPEYSGAAQKKFAWSLGLGLATIMFFVVVVNNIEGLLNLILCILCLTLLFFESVFGICLGCRIYNFVKKEKPQLCPGGVCEIHVKEDIQNISSTQVIVFFIFIFSLFLTSNIFN
jgi:hypothetical protein